MATISVPYAVSTRPSVAARLRTWFALDDDWVRPTPAIGPSDVVFAAGLELLGLFFLELLRSLGALDHTSAPQWTQWLAVTSGAALLIGRRRYPIAVGLLAALHMFVVGVTMPEVMAQFPLQTVYFTALLSMVTWGGLRRTVLIVAGLIVLLMFVWVAWQLVVGTGTDRLMASTEDVTPQGFFGPFIAGVLITVVVNAIYFFGAIAIGQISWRAARQQSRLEEQARTIADQADNLRRRAVLDERLRIARELHDVVGHHVSVIGIQAGAARRLLDKDPAATSEALSNIEGSSREAVTQMRSLLGTLRDLEDTERPSTTDSSRAPEPGLTDLPALIAERTANGVQTAYDLIESPAGAAAALSAPQSLTLYRVAQEALANVTRHSTATTARVAVRIVTDTTRPYAEVEVVDDGRPLPASSGSGLGQLGIRERVASLHGIVDIGPRLGGGYRVRVRIPLGENVERL